MARASSSLRGPLPRHEEADYSPARSAIRPAGGQRFALTSVGSIKLIQMRTPPLGNKHALLSGQIGQMTTRLRPGVLCRPCGDHDQ